MNDPRLMSAPLCFALVARHFGFRQKIINQELNLNETPHLFKILGPTVNADRISDMAAVTI
jgi:hypothetical protein